MKFTSAFVGDLSGSVGGVTASRARGGVEYFRFRKTPVNPNTALQVAVRARLSALATAWRNDLSIVQRESWVAAAEGSELQGQNLYVAYNSYRLAAGLTRVESLIAGSVGLVSPIAVASYSAGTISLTFDDGDDWAATTGFGLLVYATRPVPPSRTFENRQRLTGVVLGNTGTPPTSPTTLDYAWGNTPSSDDELRFRGVVFNNTGQFADVAIPAITVP